MRDVTNFIKNNMLLTFVAAIVLLFFLPFYVPIIFAAIVCFAINPIYEKFLIKKYKLTKNLASAIVVSLLFVVLIPFIFAGLALSKEIVRSVKDRELYVFISKVSNFFFSTASDYGLERFQQFTPFLKESGRSLVEKIGEFLAGYFSLFVQGLPMWLLLTFIFFCTVYFFLSMGEEIYSFIKKFPLVQVERLEKYKMHLEEVCQITLSTALLTGVVQALIISSIILFSNPGFFIFVFLITFIFAQLPIVGTFPVSFSLISYYLVSGSYRLAALMAILAIIAGFSDNFVRAYLLSKKDDLNPYLGLLTSIGAIFILGPIGVILGPVLVLFLKRLYQEYQ
ncbi:MAG: AI-2E family transporter [Oligoflexia bacterium]|nr:AI-2E family transporter [Oligoflexia bacterium]